MYKQYSGIAVVLKHFVANTFLRDHVLTFHRVHIHCVHQTSKVVVLTPPS